VQFNKKNYSIFTKNIRPKIIATIDDSYYISTLKNYNYVIAFIEKDLRE